MLTLDEAIEHCEEVANGMTAQGKCPECAADHRQLAEWLKDYKRLLGQQGCQLKSVDGLIENIQSKMEKVAGRYGPDTPEWERPSLKIARNAAREECIKIIKEYCGMEE